MNTNEVESFVSDLCHEYVPHCTDKCTADVVRELGNKRRVIEVEYYQLKSDFVRKMLGKVLITLTVVMMTNHEVFRNFDISILLILLRKKIWFDCVYCLFTLIR